VQKLLCPPSPNTNQIKEELRKIWELFPELEKRRKQNAGKLSGGEK